MAWWSSHGLEQNLDALTVQLRQSKQDLEEQLARLRKENDELKLYLAALLNIVVCKEIATEDEIRQLVDSLRTEETNR